LLADALKLGTACEELNAGHVFKLFCQALLSGSEEMSVQMALDVATGAQQQAYPEISRIMAEYDVALMTVEELSEILSSAATDHLRAADDCSHRARLRLCEICSAACPDDEAARGVRGVLEVVDAFAKLPFREPLKPSAIMAAESVEDCVQLARSHVDFASNAARTKGDLLRCGQALAQAKAVPEAELRLSLLTALGEGVLKSGNVKECFTLCQDLIVGSGRGWQVCADLAEAIMENEPTREKDVLSLLTFSASHCQEEALASQMERMDRADRRAKGQVRDVVPGYTFIDTHFEGWDAQSAARKAADIFDLPKGGEVYDSGSLNPLFSSHVMEQDPALAVAATEALTKEELQAADMDPLDLLRHGMTETYVYAWPHCPKDTARFTVAQLSRLGMALGGTFSLLVQSLKSEAGASSPVKVQRDQLQADAQEELSEDDPTDVPEWKASDIAVCRRLADMRDAGVPASLRSLAACLVSRKE